MRRRGDTVQTEAGLAALLSVPIVLWAASFWATEIGGDETSALMFSALRTAPAALLLLSVLPFARSGLPRGRMWIWAAVTGLLTVVVFFEGLSEGTLRAGAGNAAVLTNTPPFFVLVLGWFFLGERLSRLGIGGLLLGFAGVLVMVSSQLGGTSDVADLVVGIVFALAAAASWAIGTIIVKWLVVRDPNLDLLSLTAGQYVIGAPILLALAFGVDGAAGTEWSSAELWGSAVWLAVGASVIATLCYFAALKRVPATRVSAWLFLSPVVAVLIELGRGHTPDGVVLVGMVLAIAGVAIVNVAPQSAGQRDGLLLTEPPAEQGRAAG